MAYLFNRKEQQGNSILYMTLRCEEIKKKNIKIYSSLFLNLHIEKIKVSISIKNVFLLSEFYGIINNV